MYIQQNLRMRLSRQAFWMGVYLFSIFFISLYGNFAAKELSTFVLWIVGPMVSAYIISVNIKRFFKLPVEYWFYIIMVPFALIGIYKVVDFTAFNRYITVISLNWILMISVYFALHNEKDWIFQWKMIWFALVLVAVVGFFIDLKGIQSNYFRLAGINDNSNGLANYSRIGIIASLILINEQSIKRYHKVLLIISNIFLSFVIILTASRGIFLNILLIFSMYIGFRYFSGWKIIIYGLIILIFGNLLFTLGESYLKNFFLFERLTKYETASDAWEGEGRIEIMLTALKAIKDNPFIGVGLGQFPIYSKLKLMTHTDIIDITVQLGIAAGAIYASIYYRIFRRLVKLQYLLKDDLLLERNKLIIILLLSELMFGLTNPNWFGQLDIVVISLMIFYKNYFKQTLSPVLIRKKMF